jgi:D-lactate dehydrogenase (cytochrome)
MQAAVRAVIETIQLGVSVARIELLDERQMEAINRYSRTCYPAAPTIFFEFHGSNQRNVSEQAEFVKSLAEEHGSLAFQWATNLEERERLWKARHDAYYAALALRPGSKGFITDVCVPISRLADCIIETQKDHAEAPFPVALVGHVGDGNFHLVYAINADDPQELADASRLADRLVTRALAMAGTCTGEHGVGYGKKKYLAEEHRAALAVMRGIKRLLDPDNRMNPGKVLDP